MTGAQGGPDDEAPGLIKTVSTIVEDGSDDVEEARPSDDVTEPGVPLDTGEISEAEVAADRLSQAAEHFLDATVPAVAIDGGRGYGHYDPDLTAPAASLGIDPEVITGGTTELKQQPEAVSAGDLSVLRREDTQPEGLIRTVSSIDLPIEFQTSEDIPLSEMDEAADRASEEFAAAKTENDSHIPDATPNLADISDIPDPLHQAHPPTRKRVDKSGAREQIKQLEIELGLARDEEDTDREVELALEVAAIWQRDLNNRDCAAPLLRRVIELRPTHTQAFASLDHIYQLDWDTDRLISLLLHRAEHTIDEPERINLLSRVARLYELLQQPENALAVLQAAIETAQGDEEQLSKLQQMRARIGHEAQQFDPEDAPTRRGDPLEQQLALLASQLEYVTETEYRVEVYLQMVTLAERGGATVARRFGLLEDALAIAPHHPQVTTKLRKLLEDEQQWERLSASLEEELRHAVGGRRVDLVLELGELYHKRLSDPNRASALYQDTLRATPQDDETETRNVLPVAQAAARLALSQSRWQAAVDSLGHLIRYAGSDADRADLCWRRGAIQLQHLRDTQAAIASLQAALESVPAHRQAVDSLTAIYEESGAWKDLVQVLRQAEANAKPASWRASLLFQAGRITWQQLGDSVTASALLEGTLEREPQHIQAAGLLADLRQEQERFEDLGPLLELLLSACDDDECRHTLRLRQMAMAEALDELGAAINYGEAAQKLKPDDLDTQRRLADLYVSAQRWKQAKQQLSLLAGRLKQPEQRSIVLRRLVEVLRELDETDQAIRRTKEWLEADAHDRSALTVLAELQGANDDWRAVVDTKYALLERSSPEQQLVLYQQLGELQWDKLGNADQAEQCFQRALKLKPHSRAALQRLLDLYSDTEKWERTLPLCRTLASIEEAPTIKAKYLYTAALICRDKLQDTPQTLELLNTALDADPSNLKAFRDIDELCTGERLWKELEQNYARMIKRLPSDGFRELKVTLWHNLGEVLRSRRRDFEGAIAAFQAADALEPGNPERKRILGELYGYAGPLYVEQAVEAQHKLIADDPENPEPYRDLLAIYRRSGATDRAFALAAALEVNGQAAGEEREYFYDMRPQQLPQFQQYMNDDSWRSLYHPALDPHLSAMLAVAAPAIAASTARKLADFGLSRKDEPGLDDQHPIVELFGYASAVFNLPKSRLYLRPNQEASLLMAHTIEAPSFVAGSYVLCERTPHELAFIVARALTFLRPALFLHNALSTPVQLQTAVAAIRSLFFKKVPLPKGQRGAVNQLVGHLKKTLPKAQLQRLAAAVQPFPPSVTPDIEGWWNAAELTADRAGLLLNGDLPLSVTAIMQEPGGTLTADQRLKELVAFSISPVYFALRERFGISLGERRE